ncbi:MAG: hypothetical protein M0R39_17410 [Prolixibacteraceae bacterium]|nr:hypothetical protein [Prolixibacteraceae bacterium]
MDELKKLVIPEPLETLLFFIFGALVLGLENAKNFFDLLRGDLVVFVAKSSDQTGAVSHWLSNTFDRVNPKIIDFTVWLLVGCMVFIVASVLIALIKSTDDEVDLLHYYKSPSGRRHEVIAFLTKIVVRLAGLFGFVLCLSLFIKVLNPWLVGLVLTSVTSIKEPVSWLWLIISLVLMPVCLYIFAICLRIVMLKPRVFGQDEE